MRRIKKLLVLMVGAAIMLCGCQSKDLAVQREKNAGKGDEIVIGVPVPLEFAKKNTKFLNGVDMAVEQINTKGINGKKIRVEIANDKGNFKSAVDIAQSFCKDTGMVAVIGHWFSDICMPVSSIYEEAGMLTLVPTVSNPQLTQNGYKYVFQSITSDKSIAGKMCEYAKKKGYKRVVICYEESSYGKNLADAIEKEAQKQGLKVVDRSSGLVTEEQFKKAHDKWSALEFDAALLALNMPEGGNFIREFKTMDKDIAIVAADGLDVSGFIDELGKYAEGVVVTTTYSPYDDRKQLEIFGERYRAKYGQDYDVWAIQGYESVMIIAGAIENTGSCSPKVLAEYLRDMKPVESVLGKISFNEQGEISGRKIYQKVVESGSFRYIE